MISLFASRQIKVWLPRVWVCISLSCIFSLPMWQRSTGAGLNIYDLVLSMPALLVLLPLMIRQRWVGKGFLIAASPLALYLLYTLISMTWATSPDFSKTWRAAGQVAALFVLFSYLQLSGNSSLLRRALTIACIFTATVAAWHLAVMYGFLEAPWAATLYQGVGEQNLKAYGVKPLNAMLATLLIAPQAGMLLGLILGENNRTLRYIALLGLAVFVVFLVALERRTGQVAILVALVTCMVLYRSRLWLVLLGLAGLCAVYIMIFFPEFILSRGLSWRPAIWMSTLDSIGNAPFFGHGITNRITQVVVSDDAGNVIQHFRHPHNMALSVTYFLGLTGLALWILLWVPGLLSRMHLRAEHQSEGYIVIPLLVGLAALMFDGGEPLSPFDFDWFSFWIPVALMLSSQAVNGQVQVSDKAGLRLRYLFPSAYHRQV